MGVEPPKNGFNALIRRAMRERVSLPAVWMCHKKPAISKPGSRSHRTSGPPAP